MVNSASQGAGLAAAAVIDAMGSEAIIVRPDAGVSQISDLKGKNILTTSNAGVTRSSRSCWRRPACRVRHNP